MMTLQDQIKQVHWWKMMGRHSNFPECCINFFCFKWVYKVTRASHDRYMAVIHHRAKQGTYKYTAGYVPCPDCVRTNRQVDVHKCNRACDMSRGIIKKLEAKYIPSMRRAA